LGKTLSLRFKRFPTVFKERPSGDGASAKQAKSYFASMLRRTISGRCSSPCGDRRRIPGEQNSAIPAKSIESSPNSGYLFHDEMRNIRARKFILLTLSEIVTIPY
jgi:hypothetical protein